MLVFDISVARESQPLNAAKLMEQIEIVLKRNGLSDPQQLLPLLKEISTDEYLPLIARNHALRSRKLKSDWLTCGSGDLPRKSRFEVFPGQVEVFQIVVLGAVR
jgi:hypothetical protein